MKELERLKKSFGFAIEGILYTVRTQRNMKIHVGTAIIVLLFGLWLRISRLEVLLVFFSILLVFIMETLNTAIEKTVDLAAGEEIHPLAKIAKDVAAGAVLFSVMLAVFTGMFVFAEPLSHWIATGSRKMVDLSARGGMAVPIVFSFFLVFLLFVLFRKIQFIFTAFYTLIFLFLFLSPQLMLSGIILIASVIIFLNFLSHTEKPLHLFLQLIISFLLSWLIWQFALVV
jgi:diacylglycerol kinase